MTVTTETAMDQYSGNDATTSFAYTFAITMNTELQVIVTDASNNDTTLTEGVDYSVSGVGNAAGGTITYPLSGPPLATGETITLSGNYTYTQALDLKNQGGYFAETTETQLDKIVRQIQQVRDQGGGRALRVPITTPASFDAEIPKPDTIKGQFLQVSLDGLSIIGAGFPATSVPHTIVAGEGSTVDFGAQTGAKLGLVVRSDITAGTAQHFGFGSKIFTGTRTDTGSAPGQDHAVAGYFEAQRGAGSADSVWGINSITDVYNLDGATMGYEIDINNYSGIDPGLTPAQIFQGLTVVSGGTDPCGTAIVVTSTGANNWNRGMRLQNLMSTGEGIQFVNCGDATKITVDQALRIKNCDDTISPACLQLIPFDDSNPASDVLFYITNAADTVVTTKLTKKGAWHVGQPDVALLGMMNIRQYADGDDTITLQRYTDTSPTGWLLRAVNAANSVTTTKIGVDGRHYIGVPDSAPATAFVEASMVSFYLDETANELKCTVRYADGTTLKTGTVALV